MREEARNLAGRLTLDEKICLIKGVGAWHTYPLERLGLPDIMVADGPHGLRKQEGHGGAQGLGESLQAVCFPTAAGTAASFSRALLREIGETLGGECRAAQLSVLLGPAVNIKRSPLCGRNFEYFSEDPYLSAELAVSYTQGVQSKGVGVSIKHFAANNQEKRRMTIRSVVDERALREIYFPAFEQTVKRADPWTVMVAYSRLFDGIYCTENKRLLTDILREEWGFDGVTVSDWGAVSDRAKGVAAGMDLEMPDSGDFHKRPLLEALNSGELTMEALDEACARVIDLVLRAAEAEQADDVPPPPTDLARDHALARQYARETMVLLKNDGVLPLKKDTKAAFIGGFAKQPRFQGGGSSHVNAYKVTSAYEAAVGLGLPAEYAEGFGVRDYEYDPVKTKQAVALAAHCEVAIIFAGLPEHLDSEGQDRRHLDLPPCQSALIQAVAQAQPNTVVVLQNGAPVRMPWLNEAAAVLESYLAGEAVGEAQIDLLYGDYSPSAKLAETFPLRLQDTPCYGNFPGGTATVEYRESIYVGYRYYDKAERDVLFPFGHGLSYTQFEYSNLRLSRKNFTPGDSLEAAVTVRNTGEMDAAEIVQFYVENHMGDAFRPKTELKGFEKVFLKAGEKKRVSCVLDARSFSYWHTGLNDWYCAPGEYGILAAASSRDVRLRADVTVRGEQAASPYAELALPSYENAQVHTVSDAEFEALLGFPLPPADYPSPRRLTLDATLGDARQSPFGRLIFKLVHWATPMAAKAMGGSFGDAETQIEGAFEMPIRTIGEWSGGFLDRPMAEALISIFNRENYLQSICSLARGVGRAVKKAMK
jgi:beta-glucosidase